MMVSKPFKIFDGSVMPANIKYSHGSAVDRRAYERYPIALTGQLFVPAQSAAFACQVNGLSLGGAGVQCAEAPPLKASVVLYIDGFGRFDAIAVHYDDGILGLGFVCTDAKRIRLKEKLVIFANEGLRAVTRLRRDTRASTNSACYICRPGGDRVLCDVEDISLHGASVKTLVRPPLGEIINIGRTHGRVVRHHETGIGIEFVKSSEPNDILCRGD
jgi:hypothetical protein